MLLSEKPTSHADMQLFVSVLIRRLVKANKASFKSHLSVCSGSSQTCKIQIQSVNLFHYFIPSVFFFKYSYSGSCS